MLDPSRTQGLNLPWPKAAIGKGENLHWPAELGEEGRATIQVLEELASLSCEDDSWLYEWAPSSWTSATASTLERDIIGVKRSGSVSASRASMSSETAARLEGVSAFR